MDSIIKEELWRSVGVFALSLIIFIGLFREILTPSFLTILGIPFMITLFIFLIFIIIRKKYFNGTIIVTLLVGFLMIDGGFLLFYLYGFNINNVFLIILGGGIGFIIWKKKNKKLNTARNSDDFQKTEKTTKPRSYWSDAMRRLTGKNGH